MNYEEVNLHNIANGKANEHFKRELDRVIDNIADENTEVKHTRVITLKVKILPDQNREVGAVTVEATSNLAPHTGDGGHMVFRREGAKEKAFCQKLEQGELFPPATPIRDHAERAANDDTNA